MFIALAMLFALPGLIGGQSAAVRWSGWMAALFVLPTWLSIRPGTLDIDFRFVVGMSVLLGCMLNSSGRPSTRWVLSDLLTLGLFTIILASHMRAGTFRPLTGPEMFKNWMLPYIVGRYFIRSIDELTTLIPSFVICAIYLSIYSVFEAATHINPFLAVLGKSFFLLDEGSGYRMGLKRSQGPYYHPIYLGVAFALLLPWAQEASRRARLGQGAAWWRLSPWMIGAGLLGTVSRGPIAAAGASAIIRIFFLKKSWRIPLILLALAGGLILMTGSEMIGQMLVSVTGEESKTITIGNNETVYNGTVHRLLLFEVYAEPLAKAGFLGFGPDLEGVELDEEVSSKFWSIDSHYLTICLRHGYLGLGAFVGLAVCVLIYLGRAAWNPLERRAPISAGLFGAMATVTVSLSSVWFAPDYGVIWLFTAGIAASLHAMPRDEVLPSRLLYA